MAMAMEKLFYVVFILLSINGLIKTAVEGSLVTSLPGFTGSFPSKHYSGYVTLDGNPPKNLFYYFVVSERNPTKDPVVLWLNGGPGCSSFDGFVYEHGPFNFEEGKTPGSLPTLHLNPYSWSKVSNIIYLDSPAGVGFSYSPNTTTYETGDLQVASDTHTFLLKWFEQFPQFLSNPFYIAGESYAGVYVPTLSSNVVQGIKTGVKPILNFKGYLVGNGVADPTFDGNALVPFARGVGLISEAMFKEAEAACKGNYNVPATQRCEIILSKIDADLDQLNIYDILEPCYHGPTPTKDDNNGSSSLPSSFKELGATEKPLPVRKRIFGRAWPYRAPVKPGIIPSWPQLSNSISVPCVNDEVATTYLNDDAVKKAIHASPESQPWRLCTSLYYEHNAGSMIKYHKNLTAQGYRALIYSGDHDMCVPFTGTEAWTASLGYMIIDEWRVWISNEQVAGYTQGYANSLTFLTVKGAGHTVPEYKPRESLDFYSRWLDGRKI